MSVITKSMAKKLAVMADFFHLQPSEPSHRQSITNLPPEVLEMILRNLDCGKNSLLQYRLVSPLWKSIIDDLLEKKTMKGDVDGYPTLRTSTAWVTSRFRSEMPHPNGNPFAFSALIVTGMERPPRGVPFRYNRDYRLENFMSKARCNLTTFIMEHVRLQSTETLCNILSHLTNLKALKIKAIRILMKIEQPFRSLPNLPDLATLELNSNVVSLSDWKSIKFCSWFVDTYAEQLEYLDLKPTICGTQQVDPLPPSPLEGSHMKQLRQLKIFNAGPKFFQLSCSIPLLQHLYVGKLHRSDEMSLAVLMTFVDKFSNTLETLDLDIEWSELSHRQNRDGEGDRGLLDMMLKQFYGESAIPTVGRLSASTAAPVFSKLTKLTFPYPSNFVESAVISKLMLPKFPALRELKLGYFTDKFRYQSLNEDEFRQIHGPRIKEFLMDEDYWKLCSKLTLISVWFIGEPYEQPNFLVFSSQKEDCVK